MIAESYSKSIFSLVRKCQTIFQNYLTIYIVIISEWEFLSLYVLTCIWCYSVLDFCYSKKCVVLCHCCFHLHFPDNKQCLTYFHIIVTRVSSLLSVKVFDLFLKLVYLFSYCWLLRILCITKIIVLYRMYFLQIFFPVCGLSYSFHHIPHRPEVFFFFN